MPHFSRPHHDLPARWRAAALAMACASILLTACGKQEAKTAPLRAVKVMTVQTHGQQQAVESYSGDVRARVESMLGFRVGGKLLARPAQLGQAVRAGQLLAQIDPRDYQLGAQAAQAQVQAALTARNLAAADLKRFEAMRQQGFISGAQIEKLQAQLQATEAQLAQARAQASVQGNQASYGNLYADHAGIVTAVLAEPGQVVGAGQPVVRLAQDGARDAVINVPEDASKALRVGSNARVQSWTADGNNDGKEWPGRVREVAASADPLTRTYLVKIAIESAQSTAPALGATVRVLPELSAAKKAEAAPIKLPLSALKRDAGKTIVWVFDEKAGVVHQRQVQAGGIDGNSVIINSGVKEGETIVTAGVHTLTDGQKVMRFVDRNERDELPSDKAEVRP